MAPSWLFPVYPENSASIRSSSPLFSRGKKIGTRLFEKLLQELDQRGVCAFLTVDPRNESALALYAKWGFTDRTFVKGFYRKREDRLVLKRKPVKNG